MRFWAQKNLRLKALTCLLAIAALFFAMSMLVYPDKVLAASIRGLKIWWEIVFPALLPFVICSDILMGLGVVRFVGVFLEPLMRPLFNVPGVGGFVLVMGFASGYPVGAILATRIRNAKLCSKAEAERLLAFTATADPIFICGAISVGMLHNPQLGPPLALCYFGASIVVGLIFRFYHQHERSSLTRQSQQQLTGNVFYRAFQALYRARIEDGRPFGKILGDAVHHGITTLVLIGGFIILFSVILEIITLIHFDIFITAFFASILAPFNLEPTLLNGLANGLFEVTNGANTVSQADATLTQKLLAIGAIIGWGGLSIHAQVASIIQESDLNVKPYLVSKLLHALLCPLFIFIFLKPSRAVFTTFNFDLHNWNNLDLELWLKLIWLFVLMISVSLIIRFVKHVFVKRFS